MKLHEKIQQLREEKGLNRMAFWQELKEAFKEGALDYRTLARIETGETDARASSLSQICLALGVSMKELKEGTDEEVPLVESIKIYDYKGKYIYSEKAYIELLTDVQFNCAISRLILQPGGKTKPEKDPQDGRKFKKWMLALKGTVNCFIEGKKYVLRKGDIIKFRSHLTHYYKNTSRRNSECLIIQEPRHI